MSSCKEIAREKLAIILSPSLLNLVLWCSGYHICFTRRRSPVRSWAGSEDFLSKLPKPETLHHSNMSQRLWSIWGRNVSEKEQKHNFPKFRIHGKFLLRNAAVSSAWLSGLGVWFALRVREVPGSNPGWALQHSTRQVQPFLLFYLLWGNYLFSHPQIAFNITFIDCRQKHSGLHSRVIDSWDLSDQWESSLMECRALIGGDDVVVSRK